MKRRAFPTIISLVQLLSLLVVFGCSSADKFDPNTPEGAYKLAEEYENDDRLEEAIQKYNDVKNKHPYSRFAAQAELKIADVHYKREAFIEAQNAYQLFRDLHPKHPQIDYVVFRLAMSYFQQLPPTIDRDLTLADKAIFHFNEVVTLYPGSKHAEEANNKRAESIRMQAEKEIYVADFYIIRDTFDSALKRYSWVLKKFDGAGFESRALFGAAKSSFAIDERDKGMAYYKELMSRYPNSVDAKKAKDELRKYGAN